MTFCAACRTLSDVMPTAVYDIIIPKGEDFNFSIRILDSLDEPVGLTAPYGKAEIREADRKPLAAAFTITSLGNGTIKLSLTRAQTLTLDTNKRYLWDLFWFDTNNLSHKLLVGNADAYANITNLT